MEHEYRFDDKRKFLEAVRDLLDQGTAWKGMTILLPFPVHELDELIPPPRGKVRYFALFGALAGVLTGFGFTIYTVLSWPLITGGKRIVSIPAFMIIAFELTILFGSLAALIGFLLFAKLPAIARIRYPVECGNQFVIILKREGK